MACVKVHTVRCGAGTCLTLPTSPSGGSRQAALPSTCGAIRSPPQMQEVVCSSLTLLSVHYFAHTWCNVCHFPRLDCVAGKGADAKHKRRHVSFQAVRTAPGTPFRPKWRRRSRSRDVAKGSHHQGPKRAYPRQIRLRSSSHWDTRAKHAVAA